MDKNKANVPKIRFPGFTEPWKQRKVGEILKERNIQAPKSKQYPLMAFVANKGVAPKGDRYNREFLVNDEINKKYKQTEYGDFIYSSNNFETGSIGLNNYGKASISPVYSIFQPTEYVASDFVGRLLVRKDFINKMIRWRQGVIYGQWKIHESDFLQIDIKMPSIDEQVKIGVFFKELDNLITLHQRKLNHLQDKKKGLLQKMFPKKGEDFPELRFPGFTDSWEQHKFSELFTTLQNNALSRAELSCKQGVAMNVHYGDVLIKFGECLDVSKEELPFIIDDTCISKYKTSFLNNGDVIIADAAEDETVGKCSEIVGLTTQTVISGLHTIPCRPIKVFASGYLGYYMNSNAYHDQLLTLIQGTKVSSISKAALNNTILIYPKSKEEQAAISDCFTKINNLITLHQRKLKHLQEQKKALLQQMFI